VTHIVPFFRASLCNACRAILSISEPLYVTHVVPFFRASLRDTHRVILPSLSLGRPARLHPMACTQSCFHEALPHAVLPTTPVVLRMLI